MNQIFFIIFDNQINISRWSKTVIEKKNVYQSKYSLFTVFVWIIIYHDYVNDDAIIIIIIIKLEEKKSFPMWLEKKSKV